MTRTNTGIIYLRRRLRGAAMALQPLIRCSGGLYIIQRALFSEGVFFFTVTGILHLRRRLRARSHGSDLRAMAAPGAVVDWDAVFSSDTEGEELCPS